MDKAREVALIILKEVNAQGKYVHISLKEHLYSFKMYDRDKSFITQLVYGTLENQIVIDKVLLKFAKLKGIDPWVKNILRLGCYQILYLDKIPDSAACNESVELAKKYGPRFLQGFVNGVLRNIVRNKNSLNITEISRFPMWLVEKWEDDYGEEMAQKMMVSVNEENWITLRVNTTKTDKRTVAQELGNMGIGVEPGLYLEEALRIRTPGNIGTNPLYQKGYFTVQSESSMLVTHILDPQKGEKNLDACSAPGGKAIHMAQQMEMEGKIFAWDVHPHRVELVKRNGERMGAAIIQAEQQDASNFRPELERTMDRVLIDAPCSGLGVIHHKPDINLKTTQEKLKALSLLQWDILSVCCRYVKVGGTLVYSTCTMNIDENEKIIERFLNHFPEFVLHSFTNSLPEPLKPQVKEEGMLQLIPGRDRMDGFFIAKMRRKG